MDAGNPAWFWNGPAFASRGPTMTLFDCNFWILTWLRILANAKSIDCRVMPWQYCRCEHIVWFCMQKLVPCQHSSIVTTQCSYPKGSRCSSSSQWRSLTAIMGRQPFFKGWRSKGNLEPLCCPTEEYFRQHSPTYSSKEDNVTAKGN